MIGQYILKNGEPVQCDSLKDWCIFMGCYEHRLLRTRIGEVRVSTVFLGIDHSFGRGQPILWETMVFGDDLPDLHPGFWSGSMARYGTRSEAVRGHRVMCEKVREFYPDEPVVDIYFPFGQLMVGAGGREQDLRLNWGSTKYE